jgi:hypothetical protein
MHLEVDPMSFVRAGNATELQVADACSQEGRKVLGEAVTAFFRHSAL